MAKRAGIRLKQRWFSTDLKRDQHQNIKHQNTSGFTLLELLVATAIGGGIIAGLMFMVVQLTNTDLRESSRSETQREMQMALDYISTELREAVYVYDGNQLQTLSPFLPNAVRANGSTPVLAFWKQQPFPNWAREFCRSRTSAQTPGIACESGSSYSLVVYSLSTANNNNIWSANNARITRYALTEFGSNQNEYTQGYVNPGLFGNNFANWPRDENGMDLRNQEVRSGRPTGELGGTVATLVDYVATQQGNGNPCPTNYTISPSGNPRSFYACVQRRVNSGDNQDVVLFIRGSVNGRPGYTIAGFRETNDALPALETRVFTRGALGRIPPQ
jgi:prepilin-type N-terminal cleavage/methylation domain-containing protein